MSGYGGHDSDRVRLYMQPDGTSEYITATHCGVEAVLYTRRLACALRAAQARYSSEATLQPSVWEASQRGALHVALPTFAIASGYH
jgi:hypothetical protein